MSFDKDYPNRKDWRKPYKDSRRFARSCRSHGRCEYCLTNRLYQDRKARAAAQEQLDEYYLRRG